MSTKKNKKCIIITTINNPTKQITYYDSLLDWDLIIVGDSKTNDLLYKKLNCIYLGLDKQKELFPTIYEKIIVVTFPCIFSFFRERSTCSYRKRDFN